MTEPRHDVAIVGIGCRFPGSANSPEAFWDLLYGGVDAITDFPPDRSELLRLYDPDPAKPGRLYVRRGGFMDAIDGWDAGFFGISPREAVHIDPQHRLLLEVAWEALEDAGLPVDQLAGSPTGVFIGISTHDYGDIQIYPRHRDRIGSHSNTGTATSIAANRISYLLDLRGPSFTVDTACSSSLTALHLACRSLRSGECDLALVGGVQVHLTPELTIGFCKAAMISPDGECRAFDASANGYVRGEGVGVVVLKPLADALADGDSVYAVIAGTAINQDGHTNGMTVPNMAAQTAGLRDALTDASIAATDVHYVEAHGTGTPVGDPLEAGAIAAVFSAGRSSGTALPIGSVKTNIGHLEAASGIAGIIKTALAIKHRTIPPSLHFTTPNPAIDMPANGLRVVTAVEAWPDHTGPATAAVNSFGFGGANAHAVLRAVAGNGSPHPGDTATALSTSDDSAALLPLSARSRDALSALARSYMTFLGESSVPFGDVAAGTATQRAQHEHRLAVVAKTDEEAIDALDGFLAGEARAGLATGRIGPHKLAFVFSGMGPQWWGMGRELRATHRVFRETIERCHEALRPLAPWGLIDELDRDEASSRIAEPDLAQVTNFAIQVSLAAQLESWGIVPDAVVGHSGGEMSSAYASGALTLEDAVRVAYHRSRLQLQAGKGRILAVGLPAPDARRLLAGFESEVAVAAVNSPTSCTLAGGAAALEEIRIGLERDQVFTRYLTFAVPYHSPKMEPMRDELLAALADLRPRPATIPFVSTVTATWTAGEALGADYWWANVREPVRFADAIGTLAGEGYTTFLELSPHPVLGGSINECLSARGTQGVVLGTLRRKEDERAALLRAVGALWALGRPVRWPGVLEEQRVSANGNARTHERVSLPRYPWQHERHWFEPTPAESVSDEAPMSGGHPLLGRRLTAARPTWEASLADDRVAYLDEHVVQGGILFPGAAYVEMALAAAATLHERPAVRDLQFKQTLFLPRRADVLLQLGTDAAGARFDIHAASRTDRSRWTLHARGELGAADRAASPIDLEEIRARCTVVPFEEFYAALWRRGLEYGPAFRGAEEVWTGQGEALAHVRRPARGAPVDQDGQHVHPALLDAAFQCLIQAVASSEESASATYLPVQIAEVVLHAPVGGDFWSHARVTHRGERSVTVDVTLLGDSGAVLADIRGLHCQRLDEGGKHRAETLDDWLYDVRWERAPLAGQAGVGIGADASHVAAQVQPGADQLMRESAWVDYYSRVEPRLNEIAVVSAARALQRLGWAMTPGDRVETEALLGRLGVVPGRRALGECLLAMLEGTGVLRRWPGEWEVLRAPDDEDPDALAAALVVAYPAFATDAAILARCGASLADILTGTTDGRAVLFSDGGELVARFYRDAPASRLSHTLASDALAAVVADAPPGRSLRVIELGAGTGGTTSYALPRLPADRAEYVFTDISPLFTSQAPAHFAGYPFLHARPLDIEHDPSSQGITPNSFDVVVCANVLHGTASIAESLANVRRLLAPGGILIMVEITRRLPWLDVVFGITDGWWRFADRDLRPDHPLLGARGWASALERAGFGTVGTIRDTTHDGEAGQTVLVASEAGTPTEDGAAAGPILILADTNGTADALTARLERAGVRCVVATAGVAERRTPPGRFELPAEDSGALVRLLGTLAAEGIPPAAVVYLWGLDAPEPSELPPGEVLETQRLTSRGVLALVQAVAAPGTDAASVPRLWLVTSGTQAMEGQPTPMSLAQATIWGVARCVARERPDLKCRLVDLGATRGAGEIDALADEILGGEWDEEEIAYRDRDRFVRRLRRVSLEKAREERSAPEPGEGFLAQIGTPGALGTLALRAIERQPPKPGEVEIAIQAAGLNFREVMLAMGLIPATSNEGTFGKGRLGFDCAGTIVAVGEGVTRLAPGDEVVGIAPGSLGSYATTPAVVVVRRPASLSVEQGAAIPSAFVTAYYSLVHIARLQRGERVLIHAATGGVGLAAIQIAREVGAEVFATAGSDVKRRHLQALGVEHVMDSRSLKFADEVMERTGGAGVDVVLNSLSGEAIPKGISVLAPYGRFVEIGKRDIYEDSQIGLLAFRKNISFFAVDLDRLCLERPAVAGQMLLEVERRFSDGIYSALPVESFPISDLEGAMRHMAQAKHIGKIVLSLDDLAAKVVHSTDDSPLCRADGTYLVTGGLGGFGLAAAEWLATEGARSLALVSRRGEENGAADQIARLRAAGVRVEALRADVSNGEDVRRALDTIRASMPPLRGVFHAAMVLDDAPFGELDRERFDRALAPKIAGAWHLHEQTRRDPLDYFVAFSSIAALFGNPAQTNYAAANSFLDALAHHRRALALPSLSIDWGAIAEVGYVSRHTGVGEWLERQGYLRFTPAQAFGALGAVLRRDIHHIVAARIDWQRFAAAVPKAAASPTVRHFTRDSAADEARRAGGAQPTADAAGVRAAILTAEPEVRRERLGTYLREKVGKVLGIAPARIDAERALTEMGFDSLIAVELMTVLKMDLGVELAAVKLLQGVSLSGLAALVLEQLGPAVVPSVPAASTRVEEAPRPAPPRPAVATEVPVEAEKPSVPSPAPPVKTSERVERALAVAPAVVPPAVAGPASNGHRDLPTNGARSGRRVDYASLDYTRWSTPQRLVRGALAAGVRALADIRVEGLENLPVSGGCLLAANHLSMMDLPVVLSVLPRRTVVYASAHLQQSPVINWVLGDMGDAIYVHRGEADPDALEDGLTVLRSGGVLALGPEGTRSKTGGLGTGRPGVAYLATRAGVPVVPVAAWGQEKVSSTWKRLRRPAVTVRIGPLLHFPPSDAGAADLQRHTEQIMLAIASLLPPEYRGVYGG